MVDCGFMYSPVRDGTECCVPDDFILHEKWEVWVILRQLGKHTEKRGYLAGVDSWNILMKDSVLMLKLTLYFGFVDTEFVDKHSESYWRSKIIHTFHMELMSAPEPQQRCIIVS